MPAPFLIDNSVWARLATTPPVAAAFRALVNQHAADAIWVCSPIVAEIGYSARTPDDHTAVMQALTAFPDAPVHPDSGLTLAVQSALWQQGLLRAAGATDTLIAAYAIVNNATVIHYDRDYTHIATATRTLQQQWIVPPGTV